MSTLQPPTWRSTLCAGLLLGGIVVLQLLLGNGLVVLRRSFWLDELFTLQLLQSSSLPHAMSNLAQGGDYHPPAYFILLRSYVAAFGVDGEAGLRSFSLLCVVAALVGVFVGLRTCYSPLVAATAALAIWGHPLTIQYALEARGYSLWLAAMSWFCALLASSRPWSRPAGVPKLDNQIRQTAGLLHGIALCLLAVVIASVHYLGIISLWLVMIAQSIVGRPTRGATLAWACGTLAFLACLPLHLSQRQMLTVPGWIDPPDLEQVMSVAIALIPALVLGVVIAFWWAGRCWDSLVPATNPCPESNIRPLAGFTGLLLMPAALLVLSLVWQPLMIPRYSLVAVLGFAPLVAGLLERSGRVLLVLACAAICCCGTMQLWIAGKAAREGDLALARLIQTLRETPADVPLVFEAPHQMGPVLHYAPDLRSRSWFLDFEVDEIARPTALRIVNRDVIRRHQTLYSNSPLIKLKSLASHTKLYLVSKSPGSLRMEDYGEFQSRQIAAYVFELTISVYK